MKFNDLYWHDAIIKNIVIDRNNPGKNDTIHLEVVWPDDTHNVLSFQDVYWANLDMNFGIVCTESVFGAFSEGRENETLQKFYKKWKGLIDNVDLNFYEIETNSTNSRINIIAKGFIFNDL